MGLEACRKDLGGICTRFEAKAKEEARLSNI